MRLWQTPVHPHASFGVRSGMKMNIADIVQNIISYGCVLYPCFSAIIPDSVVWAVAGNILVINIAPPVITEFRMNVLRDIFCLLFTSRLIIRFDDTDSP